MTCPNVRPHRADEVAPWTLPEPQALVGRKGVFGWVNPYDFTDAGDGRRTYARGYPFSRRFRTDDYRPVQLPLDPPPPIAFYSYLVGGKYPDIDAVTRLAQRPPGATRMFFPEDDRLTGAILDRWNFAPLSGRVVRIASEASQYYVPELSTHDLFGPFGDIARGYVIQWCCHAMGWNVGFGGPPLTWDGPEHDPLSQLRIEVVGDLYDKIEMFAAALDTLRRTCTEREAPLGVLGEALRGRGGFLRRVGEVLAAHAV